MSPKRVHLWIRGYVQGVGFRHHARQQAMLRGLTGWVKNLPDGQVEIVAEGDEKSLEDLVDWSRRGPEMAEVESVDVQWEPYRGEFRRFGIGW